MVDPFRGDVWDLRVRGGVHPVAVISENALHHELSSVVVVAVTGSTGPRSTHVPPAEDAGPSRCDESCANCTDVASAPRAPLLRQRGRLHPAEVDAVVAAVALRIGVERFLLR